MPRPSIPVIVRVTLAWGLLALEWPTTVPTHHDGHHQFHHPFINTRFLSFHLRRAKGSLELGSLACLNVPIIVKTEGQLALIEGRRPSVTANLDLLINIRIYPALHWKIRYIFVCFTYILRKWDGIRWMVLQDCLSPIITIFSVLLYDLAIFLPGELEIFLYGSVPYLAELNT